MNSKKKKTVAIAMATALGVSGLMSPVAVYAQEELVNVQKRIEESQIKQNVSQQPVTIDNGGIPISGNININETNFPDKEFSDWIKTHITGADDDVLTPEEISNVKKIVVSNKGEIKNLKGIEYFTALEYLMCFNTGITELDVRNNTLLEILDCNNTNITTLDVSNNKQLTKLYCYNTGITTLDVHNNTLLEYLSCNNTPLAFLKLGSLNVLYTFDVPSSTTASLTVTSASFDITQAFMGIDTAKISNVQGAELDGNIVKGYSVGTPITYTYDCGTNKGNPVNLNVTLNLSKTVSTIAITGSLDTTYNGKPMEKPTVSKTGSTGDVTFTYQVKNGDTWEDYNNIPINAGTYQVQAHLAGDGFNSEAKSEYTEFTIEKATNTWTSQPYLSGWTYGQPANTPTAGAQFGNVSYSYSDTENGAYTSDVPANAGTWYVKASVEGTENYTDLEAYLPFTIARKNVEGNSDITISDINNDKDIEKLIVKDDNTVLVKGTDYDVKIKKDGNKMTVIIIFIGNYEGAIEKNLTVEETVKPEQNPQNNLQDKPKDTGSVKTGDSTQTGLLAMLSVMSAGCIALLAGKKRKKNVKEDETTPL